MSGKKPLVWSMLGLLLLPWLMGGSCSFNTSGLSDLSTAVPIVVLEDDPHSYDSFDSLLY